MLCCLHMDTANHCYCSRLWIVWILIHSTEQLAADSFLLDKLTVVPLVRKSPAFYKRRNLVVVFKLVAHPESNKINHNPPYPL